MSGLGHSASVHPEQPTTMPASAHRVQHLSDGTKVLGGPCCIMHLGDVAPGSRLVEELLAGKEPVRQEVQCLEQPVQEINLFLGVMPVIHHRLPNDGVVLVFHMGIVILLMRTGPGEGDVPGMAEADEMSGRGLAPLSEWREMSFPGCPRRQDSRAATKMVLPGDTVVLPDAGPGRHVSRI